MCTKRLSQRGPGSILLGKCAECRQVPDRFVLNEIFYFSTWREIMFVAFEKTESYLSPAVTRDETRGTYAITLRTCFGFGR